jgi:DNA-directed RNA polymerase beta subunit
MSQSNETNVKVGKVIKEKVVKEKVEKVVKEKVVKEKVVKVKAKTLIIEEEPTKMNDAIASIIKDSDKTVESTISHFASRIETEISHFASTNELSDNMFVSQSKDFGSQSRPATASFGTFASSYPEKKVEDDQYIETPWTIIGSYFQDKHLDRLVRHQIESYNNFVGYQIIKTIEMFNPVRIKSENDFDRESGLYALEIFATFENFNIYRPQIHENNGAIKVMFPQEARLRNFTYASAMTIDVKLKYIVRNGAGLGNTSTFYKTLSGIHIGKLPIMLKSNICVLSQYKFIDSQNTGECKYDAGGYFIINGSEKTVLGQERAAENRVYCYNVSKNNTKYSWSAEIKSVPDFKCISPKQISLLISSKNNGFGQPIVVQIPRIKQAIPLFIVFRALNVISDKEICEYILLNLEHEKHFIMLANLQASIIEANKHLTAEESIKYITSYVTYTPINMDRETGARKKHEFTIDVINNDLFPHCRTKQQKIHFLGYMANKLLQVNFEWIKADDRDSYINKRIDLTGVSLNNLFRNYFNRVVKDMEKQVVKEINTGSWRSTEDFTSIVNTTNIYKIIKSTTIENGLKRALATGDFGIKHANSNKVGVAQVLNRLTYVSSLSHLRRVSTPTDKSGKLIPPRKLHNTSWGFLCPAECFDPETPILMWDGTSKLAKNIMIGDVLVDDLGNPTTVRTTCSGFKNMYDVIPDKCNFMKHRVTDNHILTLKIRRHKTIRKSSENKNYTHMVEFLNRKEINFQRKNFATLKEAEDFVNSFEDDDTLDITIENYLKLNKTTRDHLFLFKVEGIHWPKKDVEMDPYLLGLWLGDGLSDGAGFALNYKTDFETLAYWENWAEENGAIITKDKRYKFSIVSKKNKDAGVAGLCNRVEEAPLKKYLRKYNLLNNKHIPNEYLTNDRDTRLKVLAGLIDTDGSVRAEGREIRICQGPANYRIIEDAYTLAMSLGFSCGIKEGKSQWTDENSGDKKFSTYKELTITGHKICEIPTLLPRKKMVPIENQTQLLRSKSFMSSKFGLLKAGFGPYVGWQLHDKRGRFCSIDGLILHNTPEGQSVGIVKNLSYMAHITISSNSEALYEYVSPHIEAIETLVPLQLFGKTKVFINGAWIGVTENPEHLFVMLKDMKCKGIINIYASIVFDFKANEIRVCNDGGRITRPLIRVKNNSILLNHNIIDDLKNGLLSWDDLFTDCKIGDAVLEYIDPEEQNYSMIATKPRDLKASVELNMMYRFTHCEIHPSTMFGVIASCIPFPEHNQSPRNTYQCLDIHENVLMSNGTKKQIKDIKVGDFVASFNPNTMQITNTTVINHYVRETDKKIYEITTVSGRVIKATEDHKFMTTNGWVEVKDMGINTRIGVYSHQDDVSNDVHEQTCVLSTEQFTEFFVEKGFEMRTIIKYKNELVEKKLLPMYNNSVNLEIIARLFGFILSDGSINIYNRTGNNLASCSFNFGTSEDVENFHTDITQCGFKALKANECDRTFNDTTHHTFALTYAGAFPALMISLGISIGKKTESQRSEIPEWIMNGTMLIKREFLSGFQGGDGCKIRWNKLFKRGYNYVCGSTTQQINPEYKQSLIHFMSQCIILLKEFDIEVSVVKEQIIETDRVLTGYKLSDKQINLIKYFDKIGYRYAHTKNIESAKVIEFLKYKENMCKNYEIFIQNIRKMHDEGRSNTSISNEHKITVSNVSDIVRSYKSGRKITCPNFKDKNIESWMQTIITKNDALFVEIESIVVIDNCLISDITVESENHSFIAGNNFLSSNCAQQKQAMGVYATNYNERLDKTAYVQTYPTRPLVDTRIMSLIKLDKIPSGCNITVAIMTHTGYNQEDSVLINKGSIDRGLFQTTIYHTEKDEDKQKINGDEEIRCKPDKTKTKGMKFANYGKVNSKGLMPENTLVENRDVIIAKVTPIKENRNDPTKVIKYEDQSKIFKTVEETYIDKNYMDRNGDGYTFAKVRLRALRKPVIGDKFCSLPTQQVLTDKGWVEIKDIDIDVHKVATLDVNGHLCYESPVAKYEYDHDDKMYYFKNKQLHLICTLNHKLYVKRRSGKQYELIEAQNVMGKPFRFQKTMTNVWPDVETIQLGDEEYKMDDWLQMLGMFIADGSCDSHNLGVFITALKERKTTFINAFLERLELIHSYHKDGNYYISGSKYPGIYQELRALSVGAFNKYLPEYVWNLSQKQSRILLEALLQGDGSSVTYKEETFDRYCTISPQLANDITRLALHCGYSGIVKVAEEPTGIARIGVRNLGSRAGQVVSATLKHTYYKVSIITKQNEPWINKKVNDSNEEKVFDYKGKVYCIEVPSSHTYYMREDDHSPALIIGNSSRHGQKGTVGNIIPEEDMPFTRDGSRPDIIINPHAIPSRMTIGQLKETLLGKVLVDLGLFGDGTSFGELEIGSISEKLLGLGYEARGNELMYNGLTGEQLEADIFMGPVFYQRLKHMVNDKQHSRSIGPMVNLTRQPAEGRSRDGGLRFGEMEKDAMVSHGAAKFTRGRMYDASDKYSVHVCKSCGLIASYNNDMHIHHCRTCDNRTDFSYVEIPYACKLLFQELTTMNVVPRLITEH